MFGCSCYILSSVAVSTAEGQVLGCVTVAFSERCVLKGVRGPVAVQGLSVWYTGPQCFRTSVSRMTCGARKFFVCSVLYCRMYVCTVMAATPLYLSLNRLHLFSLTHNGWLPQSLLLPVNIIPSIDTRISKKKRF